MKIHRVVKQIGICIALFMLGMWLNTLNKSSDSKPKEIEKKDYSVDAGILNVNTKDVDSCEYFKMQTSIGHKILSHKGDCKYCREWQVKMIDSILTVKLNNLETK